MAGPHDDGTPTQLCEFLVDGDVLEVGRARLTVSMPSEPSTSTAIYAASQVFSNLLADSAK